MRITENKLRRIIRSVIKESAINEMFDMNAPYATIAGASAHQGAGHDGGKAIRFMHDKPKYLRYDEDEHNELAEEFWEEVNAKDGVRKMYPDLFKDDNSIQGSGADDEHKAWQKWLKNKSTAAFETYKDYSC